LPQVNPNTRTAGFQTLDSRDAIAELTWMYSQRVSKTATQFMALSQFGERSTIIL